MVCLIFGSEHLPRDEVPVSDVVAWSRWCRSCFEKLSVFGWLVVVRGDLEIRLTKKIIEGKHNVRSDKIINAWAVRSKRVSG